MRAHAISVSHAHMHTHRVKWLFHLGNCQNIPREHIRLFLSSVSSSGGCVGVCQKCAGIDKTHGAKQLCFIHSLSLFFPYFFLLSPSSHSLFPCTGCEHPASEKSDQTDSQGSVSQCHRGCQSMLVPSCPTMHRARPTLLLPLLLIQGLLLHLADAQSKSTVRFYVGLQKAVFLSWWWFFSFFFFFQTPNKSYIIHVCNPTSPSSILVDMHKKGQLD